MASRKEQKEALRREREEREAQARAAERRRRMIGYGVGGLIALAVAAAVIVLVLGSGDDDPGGGQSGESSEVFPAGGEFPTPETDDLKSAADSAGCELKSFPGKSRSHTEDLAEKVEYSSKPPTSGKHYAAPSADGIFDQAPDVKELVHTLEHGRVLIWAKKQLPKDARADLRAFVEDDPYHMVLVPDETGMTYEVAATAWNAGPTENGTGRLLGCPKYEPAVYAALAAFKDEHRDNGPEAVP